MAAPRHLLGDFELVSLCDGFFRNDGGAMFGVIPKVFWEKRIPADGRNRIRVSLRPVLVRTPAGSALIDTGIGDKYTGKERDIYAIEHPPSLEAGLAEEGIDPGEIRYVINTHLHFDHAGGNTVADETGDIRPLFPKARYIVQEREWAAAVRPGDRSRASYRFDNYLPLEDAGQVERIDGEEEVLPGVTVIPTPGHTSGHQSVKIESDGQVALHFGDMIPTVAHLDLPWVMAYDLYPQETVDQKRRWLDQVAEGGWLAVFGHDPDHAWGRVRLEKGKPRFSLVSS